MPSAGIEFMEKFINKNGLEIQGSAKHVLEELMRGTGCVAADRGSIFIESENYGEKFIVVSGVPGSDGAVRIEKFSSARFKEAWELFSSLGQEG